MIIITNPINPFLLKSNSEHIYQSPQKVADEYNQFRSAMEKMKRLPIVYISTMGLTGMSAEDYLKESE
jgi:hypothetical protein